MIKSVVITNHLGESIELELRSPEKSGFFIQGIEGLGPSKATINTTELLTNDGSVWNSSRVASRNILFNLGFLEMPTIEVTRQRSYKYFPIKKRIGIVVKADTRTCETFGYVETNEPDIFSNQETTSISVICPDAYFHSLDIMNTVFSGTDHNFQFPFSNESLTVNKISFGDIHNDTQQTIFYEGDADVGVVIYIHALGLIEDITIYNSNTREIMRIDTDRLQTITGAPIGVGDDIVISTVKGDKSVTLVRNGISTNVLNALDKDADWFKLTKGDNIFAYTAGVGETNLQIRMQNQIIYEGV